MHLKPLLFYLFQCGNMKRSPPNTRVVRKLLSPKAGKNKLAGGKSKIPTPKSKLPTPKTKIPTPKSKLPTPKVKLPTPKSKLPSPKSRFATPRARAAFQHVASEYASNIVSIQKRPSVGSFIPGVSKLQSPKFEAKGKSEKSFFDLLHTGLSYYHGTSFTFILLLQAQLILVLSRLSLYGKRL